MEGIGSEIVRFNEIGSEIVLFNESIIANNNYNKLYFIVYKKSTKCYFSITMQRLHNTSQHTKNRFFIGQLDKHYYVRAYILNKAFKNLELDENEVKYYVMNKMNSVMNRNNNIYKKKQINDIFKLFVTYEKILLLDIVHAVEKYFELYKTSTIDCSKNQSNITYNDNEYDNILRINERLNVCEKSANTFPISNEGFCVKTNQCRNVVFAMNNNTNTIHDRCLCLYYLNKGSKTKVPIEYDDIDKTKFMDRAKHLLKKINTERTGSSLMDIQYTYTLVLCEIEMEKEMKKEKEKDEEKYYKINKLKTKINNLLITLTDTEILPINIYDMWTSEINSIIKGTINEHKVSKETQREIKYDKDIRNCILTND